MLLVPQLAPTHNKAWFSPAISLYSALIGVWGILGYNIPLAKDSRTLLQKSLQEQLLGANNSLNRIAKEKTYTLPHYGACILTSLTPILLPLFLPVSRIAKSCRQRKQTYCYNHLTNHPSLPAPHPPHHSSLQMTTTLVLTCKASCKLLSEP